MSTKLRAIRATLIVAAAAATPFLLQLVGLAN